MSATKNPGPRHVRTPSENRKIVFQATLNRAVELSPEFAKPYFASVAPVLSFLFDAINFVMPYLILATNATVTYAEKLWEWSQPYEPEYLFPMILGVFLMLFGGNFMMIVTCVEAYRICGWQTTWEAVKELMADYKVLRAANNADDKMDVNNDGVADVLQISDEELVTRKFLLFLRSVDPDKLSKALTGIYAGFIAVVASVRVEMARTIALGVAIGDCTNAVLHKTIAPFITALVPQEYQRWVPVGIRYASKLFGVYVASFLARILTAFHSALRGANLFSAAFLVYSKRRGYGELPKGFFYAEDVFLFALCAFGVFSQISSGFWLPLPLRLLFLPISMVETFLTYFVLYVPSDSASGVH